MTDNLDSLLHALAARPGDADLLNAAGMACHGKGDLDAALSFFARAVGANPRHLQAARNHQIVLEQLGLIPRLHTNRFMVYYFQSKHYYTPLPEERYVDAHRGTLFDLSDDRYAAIAVDPQRQLQLLSALSAFHRELPFLEEPERGRYRRDNHQFFEMDAAVLYCMLRLKKPRQLIEIGSGYSSAVMLDADDELRRNGDGIRFTFIDPDCSRLAPLLQARDGGVRVIQDLVQNVDPRTFEALDAGDILFIDSSHVVKIGSDVNLLIGTVLPRLKDGVIVHFHDVFHNFEYPSLWLDTGYPWNEAYTLRHFLMYNDAFRILFFNSYLAHRHSGAVFEKLPVVQSQWDSARWVEKSWGGRREQAEKAWLGGSLWLVKGAEAGA